jgi:hypothetical protein
LIAVFRLLKFEFYRLLFEWRVQLSIINDEYVMRYIFIRYNCVSINFERNR